MIIEVDKTGSAQGLRACLRKVSGSVGVKGILVFACEQNGFSPPAIDSILREVPQSLFGGIFPGIISGTERLGIGTLVAGINHPVEVHVVERLSDPQVDYTEVIDAMIPQTGDARTMFVLFDGYAKRISGLIESLFNVFGLEINYLGGGAGHINPSKLDLTQRPCLLTNRGIVADSALLALISQESSVAFGHGWRSIDGPYRVTESERNVIKTLDWRPAFEVYRGVVESCSGKVFNDANFFEIAKEYPFGIARFDAERIVRDPFSEGPDGSLVFGVEIPQESFLDIMTGDRESLVAAASRAFQCATQGTAGASDREVVICMDCISRALFLEGDFGREILAVHREGTPLIGALSLGEVANSGQEYLEYYNKTCVVGMLRV